MLLLASDKWGIKISATQDIESTDKFIICFYSLGVLFLLCDTEYIMRCVTDSSDFVEKHESAEQNIEIVYI